MARDGFLKRRIARAVVQHSVVPAVYAESLEPVGREHTRAGNMSVWPCSAHIGIVLWWSLVVVVVVVCVCARACVRLRAWGEAPSTAGQKSLQSSL